jgi:hypothetical protein
MWTKQLDKYTYEYSDKLFNIFEGFDNDKIHIKSIEVELKSEKDFDMEIIYQSEKIRSGRVKRSDQAMLIITTINIKILLNSVYIK